MVQKKRLDVDICGGCSKATTWTATGYVCSVYADKRATYGYRMGQCAFNMVSVSVQRRQRVGQQKQRKLR